MRSFIGGQIRMGHGDSKGARGGNQRWVQMYVISSLGGTLEWGDMVWKG